jgi:hypothetical protein
MPQPVDPSFTNAASLAAKDAGTRRLDASLAKLAAATAVKPAESKPGEIADRASLTQTNVLKAVRDAAPLRELGSRLIDLRRLLASPPSANAANDLQSKIDASLAAIRKVAESLRGGKPGDPLSPVTSPPNALATNVADGVSDIQINAPELAPGESVDVNVIVAQSAQTGGLSLSFGGANLDLGSPGVSDPNARFSLEISGPLGTREFSFTSGTSLSDIADTFNSFTDVLGLSSIVSGRAVRLDTIERNADAFVSVRVVDDGDIAGNNIGIYRYEPTDSNTADPQTRVAFDQAEGQTLTDFGQDLVAFVNGAQATNTGDTAVSVDLGGLKVAFDLSIARAQSGPTFPFRAFTVVGQGEGSAVDRVGALDPKSALNLESLALLDDAIREVEQAERERLLGRNGEPLAIDEDDVPVIREAQAKLLEEARRLGLLIDHDAAKTFDALRP